MKVIRDIFSYSYGHGAIGLTCNYCIYYKFNEDLEIGSLKRSYCSLHNFSLKIMRNEEDRILGEWFCKQFENKNAFEWGLKEFYQLKDELEDNVLYQACGKKYLNGTYFKDLPQLKEE
ncbi:hypothetical protein [Sulfurovum mangrovi]|uniref:hypothetical protein n=1 Tax=Sulfurovum mangrovi TaxID=2893889 RepID=UPI001E3D0802|nr:hypothetical protein [Sulfurovum mangrovi]UFH58044.1 hypothetical protein LN246_06725 [Sulfurovum mangrovi]